MAIGSVWRIRLDWGTEMTTRDWIAISSYLIGCFCIVSFVYGWSNDITAKSDKYMLIQFASAIGFTFSLVGLSYTIFVK